jgi:hypothetical protein
MTAGKLDPNRSSAMKSILITITSSGLRRATARHFLARGWRVVATMHARPEAPAANLQLLALDVTDVASIRARSMPATDASSTTRQKRGRCVQAADGDGGRGFYNTFGAMAVCRAIRSCACAARWSMSPQRDAGAHKPRMQQQGGGRCVYRVLATEPFGIRTKLVLRLRPTTRLRPMAERM